MNQTKDVLTTGDVAKICNVAPRTVSKWFDSGKLRGYRIPGSKDRRIPLPQLVQFMRAHDIPLNGLDSGTTRVLIVEQDRDIADLLSNALSRDAGYDVSVARSAFEAGAIAETDRPHVMLMDVGLAGLTERDAIRSIQTMPELGKCKLIALTGPLKEGEAESLKQRGFDDALAKPFDVSTVIRVVEAILAPVT